MLRLIPLILFVFGNASAAWAALGADAARGDNCTPFNSFKIGYAVPGGTIVQQSVVLAEGWQVAGWILDTASGKRYYVPEPRFFDHSVDDFVTAGPPAFVALQSSGSDPLQIAYRQVRELRRGYSRFVDRDSPRDLPTRTLVAPCFAQPLRV
ncbi:MAG: hypothetical protein M3N13_05440 [Candidatus Eremiobacteraeota bacterium]|nr:hypothetical protein [Candidatus Eremiobacteraeota bacterium]